MNNLSEKIADGVFEDLLPICQQLIQHLDPDASRCDLDRTPERLAETLEFLTSGHQQSLGALVRGALFEAPGSEIVCVTRIPFYSLCEHHVLPFFGSVHIAYLPDKKIIGLSKIPRIVQMYARRLQVQERLGEQIASALEEALNPRGVACLIEAQHLCMQMRGVSLESGSTRSMAFRGLFCSSSESRAEFLNLIK